MLFKQIGSNLVEKYLPILLIKPSLDKVRNKFWNIRKLFLDEENLEQLMKAEGRTEKAGGENDNN
jgi:hypothetical protein